MQSKRNHIINFKKQYSYEYVPITRISSQCLKLECKWYKANNGDNDEEELNDERRPTYALHHFDNLSLIGGALRVDNGIIAFSFRAPSTICIRGSRGESGRISTVPIR